MRHDVLVIGGGPVGLTSSLLLAQQGLRVALIEKQSSNRLDLGAVALDDECLRIWQSCELEQILRDDWDGGEIGRVMCEYLDARGRPFIQIEQHESDLGYPHAVAIHLGCIIGKLRNHVDQHTSIEVFSGYEMCDIREQYDRVTIKCVNLDNDTVSLDAAWAIACDGSSSKTREILKIPFHGKSLENPWLVVDFDDHNQNGYAQFRCLSQKAIVTVPMPHGTRRVERMLDPDTVDAQILDDETQVRNLLHQAWDGAISAPIRAKAIMRFHARIAERWRTGRIFLAGDAAHQTPPFAGQGLATGLRDASNLCFKIAGVHQGWLDEAVLDSYELERRPHQEKMIKLALRLGSIMAPKSNLHANCMHGTLRTLMLIPAVRKGLQLRGAGIRPKIQSGFLNSSKLSGSYLPQLWINSEDSNRIRLDQILGRRMTWIALGNKRDSGAINSSFLNPCDTLLVENRDFSDPDLMLQRRFGAGSLLLIRPDRVIHTHYRQSDSINIHERITTCVPLSTEPGCASKSALA